MAGSGRQNDDAQSMCACFAAILDLTEQAVPLYLPQINVRDNMPH